MPVFNFSELNPEIREVKTYRNSETGCVVYDDRQAFEACNQAFYTKQLSIKNSKAENDSAATSTLVENVINTSTVVANQATIQREIVYQPSNEHLLIYQISILASFVIIVFLSFKLGKLSK